VTDNFSTHTFFQLKEYIDDTEDFINIQLVNHPQNQLNSHYVDAGICLLHSKAAKLGVVYSYS
jgi:hypothetical protein